MPLYKILNLKHNDYDALKMKKMSLLYKGGYKIMENAPLFLNKLSIESNKSFDERIRCASYLPYLSQFIDHFSSSLFSDELSVKESVDADDETTLGSGSEQEDFYKLFSANCDGMGTSLHNLIKDTFTESLYHKASFIGIDFNGTANEELPTSLLQEEAMGLDKTYLYYIDPISVVDWKKDESNNKFVWIKLKYDQKIQPDPLSAPLHKVCFKVWTINNGLAHWARYETEELPLNKLPRDSDDIALVAEGDTSFTEIPIFELKIPAGLNVGFKLGPICEEIFQRRSFLVSNMNKTCITIPYVKLGPEISAPGQAMPAEAQQNPNRANMVQMSLVNQGYTVLGKDDDIGIAEAFGHSHALVDKQINDLVEKMHQLIGQMAQSASSQGKSLGRSAMSKQEDRRATEILLTAYARYVKDFTKEIYNCISNARNESIVWVVEGLSTFVEEDRITVIAELTAITTQIPIFNLIPSDVFKKKYLTRVATALIGTSSPEEDMEMQEEIEKGVESKEYKDLLNPPIPLDGGGVNVRSDIGSKHAKGGVKLPTAQEYKKPV